MNYAFENIRIDSHVLCSYGFLPSEAQTKAAEKEARAIGALEAGLDDALKKHESNIAEISQLIQAGLEKKGKRASAQKALDSAKFIYHSFNEFNIGYMHKVLNSGKKNSEEERRQFVYEMSVKNGIQDFFELVEDMFFERREEIRHTIEDSGK